MPIPSSPPYEKHTNFILSKDANVVTINRRALFGDTWQILTNRLFNDTNDLMICFRDDNWPQYEVLSVDILPITKAQADSIETFMLNTVGQIITMTLNNIVRNGIIQEPKIEITDERNDNCNYKVSFIFESQTCL